MLDSADPGATELSSSSWKSFLLFAVPVEKKTDCLHELQFLHPRLHHHQPLFVTVKRSARGEASFWTVFFSAETQYIS
jgi:hypothetical protein